MCVCVCLHRVMLVRVPVAWAMKPGGVGCGGGLVAGAIEREAEGRDAGSD